MDEILADDSSPSQENDENSYYEVMKKNVITQNIIDNDLVIESLRKQLEECQGKVAAALIAAEEEKTMQEQSLRELQELKVKHVDEVAAQVSQSLQKTNSKLTDANPAFQSIMAKINDETKT